MSATENNPQPIIEPVISSDSANPPMDVSQSRSLNKVIASIVIAGLVIVILFYKNQLGLSVNMVIGAMFILAALFCIYFYSTKRKIKTESAGIESATIKSTNIESVDIKSADTKKAHVENTNIETVTIESVKTLAPEPTEKSNANEQQFKMLIHYTPAAVAMFDSNMRYILTSERWLKDHRLESLTILGKSHYEILREEFDTPAWKEIYQRALEGEVISKEEDSWLHPDGTVTWSKWAIHPWRDSDNRIGGIIFFKEDITALKRAQQTLHDREAHLSSIINHLGNGILTINEYGIIESFNPACERLFGYTLEDVTGKNITRLILESYHSVHDTYLNNFRMGAIGSSSSTSTESSPLELEGKRKDGSTFFLELSMNVVQLVNRRIFCGIARDITHRKEAERVKDEFISTVSQELSTPLSSIRSAVSLIVDTMMEEIPSKIQPLLHTILSNCERVITTINDILVVDKVASGKLSFSLREENLALLIQKSVENNVSYEEKYGIRFELGVLPTTMIVNVDAARLMQVMDNLLSNAAKFSEKGKSVEISVYHAEGRYGVSIKDHGAGIPKEFKSHIFKRLPRSKDSTPPEKEGSGLGLYISKNILELMHGHIGFDTELGHGTTFWFELPAVKNAKEESSTKSDSSSSHSPSASSSYSEEVKGESECKSGTLYSAKDSSLNGSRSVSSKLSKKILESRSLVLHVESDKDFSTFLQTKLLTQAEIIHADTLKEAHKYLSSKSFDLIIMSLDLPNGTVDKLLDEIHSIRPSPPPIIILSAQEPAFELRQKVQKALVKGHVSEELMLANIVLMLKKE